MLSKFIIYGLIDPRTGFVRYIGKSVSGIKRPKQHRNPSSLKLVSYKNNWLKGLFASGFDYEISVLQELPGKEDLYDMEQMWIAYFRKMGAPLTNATDGGPGTLGLKRGPAKIETRMKMSVSQTGRTHTAETKSTMSLVQTGHIVTPETRIKISTAHKGVKRAPLSLEQKTKQSIAMMGNKSCVGRILSAETRAKMSAAAMGHPSTHTSSKKRVK